MSAPARTRIPVPCGCPEPCGRTVLWAQTGRKPAHPVCRKRRRAAAEHRRATVRAATPLPLEPGRDISPEEIERRFTAAKAYLAATHRHARAAGH